MVCGSGSNSLCCISKYDYDLKPDDGRFSLGIFEGIHYRDGSVRGSMGYQICTIMKCNKTTSHLCDSYVGKISILIIILFSFNAYSLNFILYYKPSFIHFYILLRTNHFLANQKRFSPSLSCQVDSIQLQLCFLSPFLPIFNSNLTWKKF